MKWKFCSEGDCPAWALASLHDVSALPAETLHQIVRHAMKDCGRCRDDDKVLEILKETPLTNLVTDILVSQAEHIEDSIKVQFLSKNPSESEKCFSFSISKTNAEKVIDKLNDARNVMERLNDVSSD